jgi:hypothetical protein
MRLLHRLQLLIQLPQATLLQAIIHPLGAVSIKAAKPGSTRAIIPGDSTKADARPQHGIAIMLDMVIGST